MFAPPPLQFSKEEIEQLKLEAQARLLEQRKSAGSATSGHSKGLKSPSSPTSNGSSSPKSVRKVNIFSRSGRSKISRPSSQDARTDQQGEGERAMRVEKAPLPASYGERPRKAPTPPQRPPRPFDDETRPRARVQASTRFPREPSTPPPALPLEESPPPLPEKSPRRRSSVVEQSASSPAPRKLTATGASIDAALTDALAQLSMQREGTALPAEEGSSLPLVTVPLIPTRWIDEFESPMAVKPLSRTVQRTGDSGDGVRGKYLGRYGAQAGKIDKATRTRASAATTLEASLAVLNISGSKPEGRVPEPAVAAMEDVLSRSKGRESTKRQRKGETVGSMHNGGSFATSRQLTMVHPQHSAMISTQHATIPTPLALLNKALPATPSSVTTTPTEMYQFPPRGALPTVPKKSKKRSVKVRSPLSVVAVTDSRSNFNDFSPGASPGRLAPIPELVNSIENSPPPSSGVTTPTATQIQLRGGSVVTVTPPELTAWQAHAYIQGPIKLLIPVIMPREGSVANLEPFQEAVANLYQHALVVPRRRSDDAVVEDVCEWFDDFGFDDIKFDGDVIMIEDIMAEEEDDIEGEGYERFSTPPPGPVEKMIAKEVVNSVQRPFVPPVETEETLRARGIARLSQGSTGSDRSRKLSSVSGKQPSIVSLLPQPEQSMLSALMGGATEARNSTQSSAAAPSLEQGRMSWNYNDVVEMRLQQQPGWAAPAAARKKSGSQKSSKSTSNPMSKVRKFMAASSGL
ncbi:hypothetical protein LTR62_005004 [Meristemomyces frigidus]|uniref:Uncharacterized protein n=1 Tax=Meristemomyces frigidus TaxID=1508187 RepID=A0AAN7YK94_9PEZI|nr:hypothetical protein LTR62_005004 [Meristemomyces frigidus]